MGDTDNLPPVQYLIMEVLAARTRLGEAYWTFPKRFTRDLEALSKQGLLWFKAAVAPRTYMAFLTDAGRAAAMSAAYAPPLDPERRDVQILLAVARDYLRAFTEDSQPLPEGFEYRDVQEVVMQQGGRT